MVPDIFEFLEKLQVVRQAVKDLSIDSPAIRAIQIGYESVLADLFIYAGLTDRQADLIWDITDPE